MYQLTISHERIDELRRGSLATSDEVKTLADLAYYSTTARPVSAEFRDAEPGDPRWHGFNNREHYMSTVGHPKYVVRELYDVPPVNPENYVTLPRRLTPDMEKVFAGGRMHSGVLHDAYAQLVAVGARNLAGAYHPGKSFALPPVLAVTAHALHTQDNRMTSHPVFCVFETRTVPAAEGYNESRIEWRHVDQDFNASASQARRLESLYQGGRCEDNDYRGWRRLAVREEKVFVTACFTNAGCIEYLRVNGHNLKDPYVYVMSGYRNAEWQLIRDTLMKEFPNV